METITEDAIKAVVAIIIGVGAILSFKEFLAGIILIAVGAVIIGVNEKLRSLFLSFIKWLLEKVTGKEPSQKIESSLGGVQQQVRSGGDSYTAGGDINIGDKSETQKKAKLELYYDKDETYYNVPIVNISPVKNGLFLHVMVKNKSEILAKNCYGELVEVQEYQKSKYSKVKTFTAPVVLKWAHEDFGKKLDVDKDIPRRLDICHTIDGFDYFLFMTERGPRGIQTQFPKGEYKIKVRVKGDNTDFSYGEYLIDFDGNWKNIRIDNL